MNEAHEVCQQCLFWIAQNSAIGHCHRNPPTVFLPDRDKHPATHFPTTNASSFCGEWARRDQSITEWQYSKD